MAKSLYISLIRGPGGGDRESKDMLEAIINYCKNEKMIDVTTDSKKITIDACDDSWDFQDPLMFSVIVSSYIDELIKSLSTKRIGTLTLDLGSSNLV